MWSISDKIYFDNVVIADDEVHAEKWSEVTWSLKKKNVSHESVMFKKKIKPNKFLFNIFNIESLATV